MVNDELALNMMSEEERKEEELMNTMKMEPILERTMIEEEPLITLKKKRIKVTDYFLIGMISVLSVVFVVVLFNVL
ncbi:MAG: hypothetical protein PUA90_03185 [bacterium]|nr:hypothetical protein [bacterium]